MSDARGLGIKFRAVFLAVVTTVGLGLAGMNPVNAETGVWHQAFERASEEGACESPSGETPWQGSFTGQREWAPSWAQWPNDGAGGWVCERYINWANTASYPSAGCIVAVTVPLLGDYYADFQGGFAWPAGRNLYSDSDCQSVSGALFTVPIVYAPAGFDPNVLCRQAFGTSVETTSGTGVADTYFCE